MRDEEEEEEEDEETQGAKTKEIRGRRGVKAREDGCNGNGRPGSGLATVICVFDANKKGDRSFDDLIEPNDRETDIREDRERHAKRYRRR